MLPFSVQMMHSQTTEYQATDLAVERDSLLLLAASRETSRTQAECLSLHSINALEGMFAPKCVPFFLSAPLMAALSMQAFLMSRSHSAREAF